MIDSNGGLPLMLLCVTRAPKSLYRRTGYPLRKRVAQMYYRIYEDSDVVGLIDLENRTFKYEGSHSDVKPILKNIENEYFASVVVRDTDGPTTHHFDVPKTGEELASTLDNQFETINDPDAGSPSNEDDPDHVAGERVRREDIPEDHPLRPPAEPSDYLVQQQEKAEQVRSSHENEEDTDLPSHWSESDSGDEYTFEELKEEGVDESTLENLRDD